MKLASTRRNLDQHKHARYLTLDGLNRTVREARHGHGTSTMRGVAAGPPTPSGGTPAVTGRSRANTYTFSRVSLTFLLPLSYQSCYVFVWISFFFALLLFVAYMICGEEADLSVLKRGQSGERQGFWATIHDHNFVYRSPVTVRRRRGERCCSPCNRYQVPGPGTSQKVRRPSDRSGMRFSVESPEQWPVAEEVRHLPRVNGRVTARSGDFWVV